MYRKTVLLLIFGLAVAILLLGIWIDKRQSELARRCAEAYDNSEAQALTLDVLPVNFPAAVTDRFDWTHHDPETNAKQYQISGTNIVPHADSSLEVFQPVIIFFSGARDGRELLRVSADRGAVVFEKRRERGSAVAEWKTILDKGILSGNVTMETPDGITAHFESAQWNAQNRMIVSDAPVTIETSHFTVYGTGLESVAAINADEIIIKKDVRVVFDEQADGAFAKAFELGDSAIRGKDVGMVITCDGTMSYQISSKNVTFEDNVLLCPVTGSYSETPVAEARAAWIARFDAGKEAVLTSGAIDGPVLFARKSIAVKLEPAGPSGEGAGTPGAIEELIALEDVWLLRGNDLAHGDQLTFGPGRATVIGKPAYLSQNGLELEAPVFRISGFAGEETAAVSSDKPGRLRSAVAWGTLGASSADTAPRPMVITWEKRFLWSQEQKNATFEGNVVALDESGRLDTDRLILSFGGESADDLGLNSMRARGNVRYEEKDTLIKTKEMLYDRVTGAIELTGGEEGRAALKMGKDIIESETLTITRNKREYQLSGDGLGRMRYFETADAQANADEPSYDIRWNKRCAYGEDLATFTGDVVALRGDSELRCDTLSMELAESKKPGEGRHPTRVVADGHVVFDDRDSPEGIRAQGDRMTYDYDSQIMKLERTTPYDATVRNPPPDAVAAIDISSHRLTSRMFHYIEEEGTKERFLWTRRGGEVDAKRLGSGATLDKTLERTRVRCVGSILYGSANRIVTLLPKADLSLGQGLLPERLLPVDAERLAETVVVLFVKDVRVRRETLDRTTGKFRVDLTLDCNFLEVHFAPVEGPDGDKKKGVVRMRAYGDVEMVRVGDPNQTATGGSAIWRSVPRHEWIAEIEGDPYATLTQDQTRTTCKKVIFQGVPVDVQLEDVISIEAAPQ